jgi:hypothetical protein
VEGGTRHTVLTYICHKKRYVPKVGLAQSGSFVNCNELLICTGIYAQGSAAHVTQCLMESYQAHNARRKTAHSCFWLARVMRVGCSPSKSQGSLLSGNHPRLTLFKGLGLECRHMHLLVPLLGGPVGATHSSSSSSSSSSRAAVRDDEPPSETHMLQWPTPSDA